MENKKILKEIILNLIITSGISSTLFLVNKYFAIYLGIQKLGLMKLFTQLLSYLNLAEIGITSASAFALYKPLVEKNFIQISIIMNTITSLYKKVFLFILLIGLLLNPIIPFFIKEEAIDNSVYLYWSLYVINTALSYSFIKYSVLFTADQKFSFVRLIQGNSKIFCQLLQIIIIIKWRSFFLFILLLILDNIIQFIFYRHHYKRFYHYIFKTKIEDKSILKNLKNLFWHKLATLVVFNTDLILISKYISLEIVGIYASYQMIIQMLITILNIFLNILRPKIGKFIAENTKESIFNYWKYLNILFLMISIIFAECSYILVDSFIELWLGKKFLLSQLTIILIISNLFIQCFRGVTDIFKEGCGFFDDIYLPISEAVLNFVISLILVKYIGLNGIIVGTIISNLIIIFIAKPLLVFKRCFDKDWKEYVKIYSWYLFLIIISLLSFTHLIKIFIVLEINGWVEWIVSAIKILIVVGSTAILIFLSDRNFRQLIKTITSR